MKYAKPITTAILVTLVTMTTQAAEVEVHITGLTPDTGTLYLRMVTSEKEFDTDFTASSSESIQTTAVLPVDGDSAYWKASALKPGTYAIQVFQDLNGNSELDTRLFGIPTEPWGVSNNPAGSFGPPDWDDGRFILPASGTDINITMRNLKTENE